MKKIYVLGVLIVLVIILSQPLLTKLFLDDNKLINIIVIIGYAIVLSLSFLIYKQMHLLSDLKRNKISNYSDSLRNEIDKLYELTKNDFIFYKHDKNQAFIKVSDSVLDILQISPEDFQKHYKRYKADLLYDGVFEKAEEYNNKGMRVPPYEISLRNKKGNYIQFEVTESAIYNHNNELVSIWGTLHHLHEIKEELNLSNDVEDTKLNLIFENVNDGVLLIKGDRFVDCNSKALEIFESSMDQIIMYSPFSNKYSPITQPSGKNSKEDALRRMNLAYEGKPQEFEWTHLKQSGTPFVAEIKLLRYDYNNEVYLLAIVKDISSKHKLKTILNEKIQLINILFKHSSISMIEFNVEKEIIDFNSASSKLFGIGKEVINKKIYHVLNNNEFEKILLTVQDCKGKYIKINIPSPKSKENLEILTKIVPVVEDGIFKGGIVLFEKVDELKKLKMDLLVQQNNFNEIIEKSNDVLYKFDLLEKNYNYVSKSVEKLLGYSVKEFIKMSESEIKSILHPKELDRANLILAKLYDGRQKNKHQELEYRIIDKSGSVKWIRDSYSIITNESKQAIAIIGVISDLTERKQKDIQLSRKEFLLKLITEKPDQGMLVLLDNKIELINSNTSKITGFSEKDLLKMDCLLLKASKNTQLQLKEEYLDIISGKSKNNTLDYWLETKKGKQIFIKSKYYLDSDNPNNRYVLFTDATKDKIEEYKVNPTEELKIELESHLKDF